MSRPAILLLDTIGEEGLEILRSFADLEDGRQLSRGQLESGISRFEGLVVKSGNYVDRELIARATRLRLIGRAGSGVDNIDMDAARAHGVAVITSPRGNACSVAEHVLCTTLLLVHRLHEAHRAALGNDFRRASWQGRNLASLVVGVVGVGHIGRAVIAKIAPLCRRLYAYDPFVADWSSMLEHGAEALGDLYSLLDRCDVVTLHVPLTDGTRHLLDANAFARMKPGCILINTARGEVIDDEALLRAMDEGVVAAAALDTLAPDPPFNVAPAQVRYSHFWVHHPRVYYTPHLAAGTQEALRDVATDLARGMEQFFLGGLTATPAYHAGYGGAP